MLQKKLKAFKYLTAGLAVSIFTILLLEYFLKTPTQKPPKLQKAKKSSDLFLEEIKEPKINFKDISLEAGIRFTHNNGAFGKKYVPEAMGGGVAFFDFDNDNDPDLLFINSKEFGSKNKKNPQISSAELYENIGDSKFTNVTAQKGIKANCYGQGVAIGDIDNDGFKDVFITCLGKNIMLKNNAGKFFSDMSESSGLEGSSKHWSIAAGFFDMDNDGDLDLFVGNYLDWSPEKNEATVLELGDANLKMPGPGDFSGTYSYLYENLGDGSFKDISETSGIQLNSFNGSPLGKSLGVLFHDFDGDNLLDIYVANDLVENFLFKNLGKAKFKNIAIEQGIAFDRNGKATGSMGLDLAFPYNDDALSVAVGNFVEETTSMFMRENIGDIFSDNSLAEGIGTITSKRITFGLVFFDFDLDGWQDIYEVNGNLDKSYAVYGAEKNSSGSLKAAFQDSLMGIESKTKIDFKLKPKLGYEYEQPGDLFWNCAQECKFPFRKIENTGILGKAIVGRGLAYADIDGDGDLDLIITQTGGDAILVRNEQETGNNWLRVKLIDEIGNYFAIGSTIKLTTDGITQIRLVNPTRSYASQVELISSFGLGKNKSIEKLTVIWPDGEEISYPVNEINQMVTILRKGKK